MNNFQKILGKRGREAEKSVQQNTQYFITEVVWKQKLNVVLQNGKTKQPNNILKEFWDSQRN